MEEGADADAIKEQVRSGSLARGFEASALLLSEEYEAYRAQTAALTARQLALAFFVCAMAVCSVGAVLTTNALLKKRQYGILLANGFTVLDIAAELVGEIVLLLSCSGVLAWGAKWAELMRSEDLFRPVLLSAHLGVTPWLCLLLMLAFTLSAAVVPVIKLFQYQPCELIGGDVNG